MYSLFDMMKQAQNGTALEAYSKQFGLAQEQATKAMEALIPAFSSGLKRNTANQSDMASLMLDSDRYSQYFEDLTRAFTPEGMADGQAALGKIFGSKDAAEAIAAQAEKMTGIGQDILKSMMPAMADTLMGGIVKQTTDQFETLVKSFNPNAMPDLMSKWMQAAGLSGKPKAQSLFDNPFAKSMEAMMGGTPATTDSLTKLFGDNPFAKAMTDMMATMNAGLKPTGSFGQSEPSHAAYQAEITKFFNTMFESGIEAQKTYQKSVETIIDTYWKGPSKA